MGGNARKVVITDSTPNERWERRREEDSDNEREQIANGQVGIGGMNA